jgi:hypothetical protein
MRIFILIVLVSVAHEVLAQEKLDWVTLSIDKDLLDYDSAKKSLLIPFTFSHNSEQDVIVFGLSGIPQRVPFDLKELCSPKDTGGGIAFAVYKPDGKRENYQVTISDDFDQRPVTREVLDSLFRVSNERFRKTKIILSKNDRVSFEKEILLEDFLLEPGEYFLQLVYYSGENILRIINLQEEKKSGAKVFQGCAMSNKVRFVVK